MNTLYRTLLVSITVLSIYQVFLLEKSIPDIKQAVLDSQKNVVTLEAELTKQRDILTVLQTELTAFHKETNERIAKEQKYKDTLKSVRLAVSKVNEADLMRKAGNLVKATEILLSVKAPLWKAGDVFQSEQIIFQGFMTPIDAITAKWKSGDASADTNQLTTAITVVLDKLSREF